MPFLDAALAFSITMLVVSTAVTQILRLIKNTAKLRKAQLAKMMDEFVTNELKPVVDREWNRLKKGATAAVTAELDSAAQKLDKQLFRSGELESLVEVSTEGVIDRLKQTDFGQKLEKEIGAKARSVFDELGRRYEVIGDRFTASFRAHSQRWGTVIAFVLALVVNVDSIHIADLFLRSDSMRQSVISQLDTFTEDYDALVESLKKDENQETVTTKDVEDAFKQSREQLDVVTSVGLPVGWYFFPYSECPWMSAQTAGAESLQSKTEIKDGRKMANPRDWATWLLGITLTALLAGLGAPFWYDAVLGISRITQNAGGAKSKKPASS